MGRWDLSEATQVRVQLKNEGSAPRRPRVQLTSNGGPTDRSPPRLRWPPAPSGRSWFRSRRPCRSEGVAVSQAGLLRRSKRHRNQFRQRRGRRRQDQRPNMTARRRCVVESITADAPPAVLPDWLGKRPPRARRLGQDARRRVRRPGHRRDEVEHLRPELLGQGDALEQGQPDPRRRRGQVPFREEARLSTTTIHEGAEAAPTMPAASSRPTASGCSATVTSRRG